MFKLLITATMVAASDPSKCLEIDFKTLVTKLDEDCCKIKGFAWCADSFVQEWSPNICFKDQDTTAHSYSCWDPSLYNKDAHDSSKCWDS